MIYLWDALEACHQALAEVSGPHRISGLYAIIRLLIRVEVFPRCEAHGTDTVAVTYHLVLRNFACCTETSTQRGGKRAATESAFLSTCGPNTLAVIHVPRIEMRKHTSGEDGSHTHTRTATNIPIVTN